MYTIALPQPPYSPDPALADFLLLPKLKSTLIGQRFQMIQDYRKLADGAMHDPKKGYQGCFQKWQWLWERCINAGGENYEGDKAHSVAGMSEKIIKK
jgi:hypothetical protein